MKRLKCLIKIFVLILICHPITAQNADLEVFGHIISEQLKEVENRILTADSTGKILPIPDGDKLTFYDDAGLPRICVQTKMDTTTVSYLNNVGEVVFSYQLRDSTSSSFAPGQRGQNEVFTEAEIEREYGPFTSRRRCNGMMNKTIYFKKNAQNVNEPVMITDCNSSFNGGGGYCGFEFPINSTPFSTGVAINQDVMQFYNQQNQKAVTMLEDGLQVLQINGQDATASLLTKNGMEFIEQLGLDLFFGSTAFRIAANQLVYELFADLVNIIGDLTVSGTINSSVNHPQDPTKSIHHAALQTPMPYSMYKGVITTNSAKKAQVELPDYFRSLHSDVNYYLTTPNSFAEARISQNLNGNQFEIETEEPNVTVHWMVVADQDNPALRKKPFQTIRAKASVPQRTETRLHQPGAFMLEEDLPPKD